VCGKTEIEKHAKGKKLYRLKKSLFYFRKYLEFLNYFLPLFNNLTLEMRKGGNCLENRFKMLYNKEHIYSTELPN
jgi:hypothetical protein